MSYSVFLVITLNCSCTRDRKNNRNSENFISHETETLVCRSVPIILRTEGIVSKISEDSIGYNYVVSITENETKFKIKSINYDSWRIETIKIKKKSDKSFKVLYTSFYWREDKYINFYSGWYHLSKKSNVLECDILKNERNEDRTINIIMCAEDAAKSIVINQSGTK